MYAVDTVQFRLHKDGAIEHAMIYVSLWRLRKLSFLSLDRNSCFAALPAQSTKYTRLICKACWIRIAFGVSRVAGDSPPDFHCCLVSDLILECSILPTRLARHESFF